MASLIDKALAEAGVTPLDRWLGPAWMCPDCGRVVRTAPRMFGGERFHNDRCASALVRVRIEEA